MIHYLLIRRDLPFGVTLAQLAHAAADSMADWIKYNSYIQPYAGYMNADEIDFPDHKMMTVVVLGVKDKRTLLKWEKKLGKLRLKFTSIREPDAPWHNQLMAIGVWPDDREFLSGHFKKLNTYSVYTAKFEDFGGEVGKQ